MLTFRHSRDGVLCLSDEVARVLRSFRQVAPDALEAGGVLLGRYLRDGRDVVVDRASVPQSTDERGRYSFCRSIEHQRFIDEAWESSGGTCAYLGEWHTHAEPVPYPSKVDLDDWKRSMREDFVDAQACFYVIVGQRVTRCWEGDRSTLTVARLSRVPTAPASARSP